MKTAVELMDSRKFFSVIEGMANIWAEPTSTDEEKARHLQAVLDFASGQEWKPTYVAGGLPELVRIKQRGIKALIPMPELTLHDAEAFGKQMGKNAGESLVEALKPKRKRRTKAEMQADKGELVEQKPKTRAEAKKLFLEAADKITPDEKAKFAAEDAANKPVSQLDALRKAVREVIKPNWNNVQSDGYRAFNIKMIRDGQALSMYPGNWVDALKAEGLPVRMNGQEAQIIFQVLNMAADGKSNGDGKIEKWINVKIA